MGSSCFSHGYSIGFDALVQVGAKVRFVDAITAIAAPRRREILRLIWDRELSAGEIAAALPVTFGAVSQHLSVLRDAGIVDVRQEGTYRYYRANQERIGPLAAALEAYWSDALDRLAVEAERQEPTAT
jgi:DNA-binding transcriptional ArsR family regulator